MMTETAETKSVPLLEEAKLQARVLVPVIRALRQQLGQAAADKLIEGALREWSRDLYRRIAEERGAEGKAAYEAAFATLRPRIGDAIERELIRDDAEERVYNVTRCAYADFFRDLGEPELGRFLMCDVDHDIADATDGAVELVRTQTIMSGAAYCDFRWRFRNAG